MSDRAYYAALARPDDINIPAGQGKTALSHDREVCVFNALKH